MTENAAHIAEIRARLLSLSEGERANRAEIARHLALGIIALPDDESDAAIEFMRSELLKSFIDRSVSVARAIEMADEILDETMLVIIDIAASGGHEGWA